MPASATALQPASELAPSLKLTLPVGLLPATVAVKVTLAPTADGLFELASDVVVGAPAPIATVTLSAVGDAVPTVTVTPYVLSV